MEKTRTSTKKKATKFTTIEVDFAKDTRKKLQRAADLAHVTLDQVVSVVLALEVVCNKPVKKNQSVGIGFGEK